MTTKKAYSCQGKSFGEIFWCTGSRFCWRGRRSCFDSYRMFPVFFVLRIRRRMIEDDFQKLLSLAIDQVDANKHQGPTDDLIHAQIFTKQRHGKKGCHHGLA